MGIGGVSPCALFFLVLVLFSFSSKAQDYTDDGGAGGASTDVSSPSRPSPEEESCDGVFLSYTFLSREKLFPHVKNASAQAWAFNATTTVLNAGSTEVKAWKAFVGFQHEEILVSASGAVLVGGEDFPAEVGNGTYVSGYPTADLKTAIETAGDMEQIRVEVQMRGTQFGVKPPGVPMPKTIGLVNDGYKCPAPKLLRKPLPPPLPLHT